MAFDRCRNCGTDRDKGQLICPACHSQKIAKVPVRQRPPPVLPLPDLELNPPKSRLPFTLFAQKEWAGWIALKVARHNNFKPYSQERDELLSVATEVVCSLYKRPARGFWDGIESTPNIQVWSSMATFAAVGSPANPKLYREKGFNLKRVPKGGDPEGLFRGWSYPWILSECHREAERLRNGGTYRTCRPANRPAQVASLGALADDLADDREPVVEIFAPPRLPVPATMDVIDDVYYGRRLAGRNRRSG